MELKITPNNIESKMSNQEISLSKEEAGHVIKLLLEEVKSLKADCKRLKIENEIEPKFDSDLLRYLRLHGFVLMYCGSSASSDIEKINNIDTRDNHDKKLAWRKYNIAEVVLNNFFDINLIASHEAATEIATSIISNGRPGIVIPHEQWKLKKPDLSTPPDLSLRVVGTS